MRTIARSYFVASLVGNNPKRCEKRRLYIAAWPLHLETSRRCHKAALRTVWARVLFGCRNAMGRRPGGSPCVSAYFLRMAGRRNASVRLTLSGKHRINCFVLFFFVCMRPMDRAPLDRICRTPFFSFSFFFSRKSQACCTAHHTTKRKQSQADALKRNDI